jgi:endonuclease G
LCREGYAVGYDFERKTPIWVAYHITKESVEKKFNRSNSFQADRDIPAEYRSTLQDYEHSGYDRGHMAPAATMDFSKESMQESFLLSNMTPQLPGLNRQGWRYLEEYIRTWAEERGELYIVTGALFEKEDQFIGDGIRVPSGYFKVVFDLAQCAGLAFIVPQQNISKAQLPDFIVSIDEVEARSGLDFLSLLPDDEEANIEEVINVMW